MARSAQAAVEVIQADDCPYLSCNRNCAACSAAQRQRCIAAACDDLEDSVRDRRENGGTTATIKSRALDLIRLMVADLETS